MHGGDDDEYASHVGSETDEMMEKTAEDVNVRDSTSANRPRSRSMFGMTSPIRHRGRSKVGPTPHDTATLPAFERAIPRVTDDGQWDTYGIPQSDTASHQRAPNSIDGRALSPLEGGALSAAEGGRGAPGLEKRSSKESLFERRDTESTIPVMASVHDVIIPDGGNTPPGRGSLEHVDGGVNGEWMEDDLGSANASLTIRRWQSTKFGASEGGVAFKVHSGYTMETDV